jgi:hypothetical protein
MNVFQLDFNTRLQAWYEFRNKIKNKSVSEKCIEIDNFWQKCPIVNHYLHTDYVTDWPDPWVLLSENMYCNVAKALGICYTLLLTGVNDIKMVQAIDNNNEEVILVLVDNAKYILNYWPNTVVNNCLQDFTIKQTVNIDHIKTKIGAL